MCGKFTFLQIGNEVGHICPQSGWRRDAKAKKNRQVYSEEKGKISCYTISAAVKLKQCIFGKIKQGWVGFRLTEAFGQYFYQKK